MAKQGKKPATGRVTVRFQFQAGAARVFRGWTDPNLIGAWMPGTEHAVSVSVTSEAGRGGGFECTLRLDNGDEAQMSAAFVEYEPSRRLIYTLQWRIEGAPEPAPKTRINVAFAKRGNGTEVVLTHSGIPAAAKAAATAGWNNAFRRLDALI